MSNKPIIIGIAGGTGSGKTSVANAILDAFCQESILMIQQDSYYKSQSHLSFRERLKTNYDHPGTFDNDLLISHLQKLMQYEAIEKPIYDFPTHDRSEQTIRVEPKDVIIVEGILVLEHAPLRDLMDIKVYVDTDADIRILRRMIRDIRERGRTMESVIEQYLSDVRPMHNEYVEPSKHYANIVIPDGGENYVAIDLMVIRIRAFLDRNEQVLSK